MAGGTDELGRYLQDARLRRGWTLGELAERSGLSRTTLFQLERGTTNRPQLATLHKVAQTLEISLHELQRPHSESSAGDSPATRFDRLTNPAVQEVAQQYPEVFRHWHAADWDELYSTVGMGGALSPEGALAGAAQINRRKRVMEQLQVVLETHLGEVAVALVERLYQLVQVGSGGGNMSIPLTGTLKMPS